ncbi:hypothetical protein BD414DRAFT_224112 [Trametes punicea]|nr:hypothetical protein BD414DRAFT_224112 [Trametes punicea]
MFVHAAREIRATFRIRCTQHRVREKLSAYIQSCVRPLSWVSGSPLPEASPEGTPNTPHSRPSVVQQRTKSVSEKAWLLLGIRWRRRRCEISGAGSRVPRFPLNLTNRGLTIPRVNGHSATSRQRQTRWFRTWMQCREGNRPDHPRPTETVPLRQCHPIRPRVSQEGRWNTAQRCRTASQDGYPGAEASRIQWSRSCLCKIHNSARYVTWFRKSAATYSFLIPHCRNLCPEMQSSRLTQPSSNRTTTLRNCNGSKWVFVLPCWPTACDMSLPGPLPLSVSTPSAGGETADYPS